MDPLEDPDTFIAAFQERLRRERVERGLTQLQVATALGLKLSTYKHYETRQGSTFPVHLLPKLSVLFDRSFTFWITGHDIYSRPRGKLRIVPKQGTLT